MLENDKEEDKINLKNPFAEEEPKKEPEQIMTLDSMLKNEGDLINLNNPFAENVPKEEPKIEPDIKIPLEPLIENIKEKPEMRRRSNSIKDIKKRNELEKIETKYENEPHVFIVRNGKAFSYQVLKSSKPLEHLNIRMTNDSPSVYLIKEINYKDIVLYNIKDFLLMFGLLMASSFNFNYLYYPFLICGLLYSLLIYNNNEAQRKRKFIYNLIILIYSSLMLIFGIVIIILFSKKNDAICDNKDLFINLGVPYLLSEGIFDLIKTLFGPVLMIIICIISLILGKKSNFNDHDLEQKKIIDFPSLSIFYKKVLKYLFLSFFIIAAFATFNKSFLTLIYLFLFYVTFSIYLISSEDKMYLMYKIALYIEVILIACQLLLINITNTYSLADNYFNYYKDSLKNDSFAKMWGKIGFYSAYYKKDDYSTTFIDWAGYLFGCLSFTSLVFIIKTISSNTHERLKRSERNYEKKNYSYFEKGFFGKLLEKVIFICSNQYFMLHLIRILSILWVYIIRSFFSIFILIWLFFSFLYLDPNPIRLLSSLILVPGITISLLCITGSRIFKSDFEDFDDEKTVKFLNFSLGNYDYDLIFFYILNLFYSIVICFIIFKPKMKEIIIEPRKVQPKLKLIDEKKETGLKEPLLQIKEEDNNNINNENNINNINTNEVSNNNIINENNINLIKDNTDKKINDKNIEITPSLGDIIAEKDAFKEAEDVTFINLVKKFIFVHINKITLVVMYFVTNDEINLFHFFLAIVFMIQLIRPFLIERIVIYILILFQSLFFIEYIMDLIKVYCFDYFAENLTRIKFFLSYKVNKEDPKSLFDTSIEIFIYGAVYCFYIHHQIYNYDYYKKLAKEDKVTLSQYIEIHIKNKTVKDTLINIGNIIMEIYTWGITFLFILFACYFEVNLIFAIELLFFLICMYNFCILVQLTKGLEEKKVNLVYPRIVLYVSGIHTVLVYFYQVLCLDFTGLKDKIKNSDHFFVKNLPSFGFTIYKDDEIFLSLLPHYFLNFISLLYLRKVKYTPKEIVEKKLKRHAQREGPQKTNIKGPDKKEDKKQEDKIIIKEDKKEDKKSEDNIIIKEDKKEEKEEEKKIKDNIIIKDEQKDGKKPKKIIWGKLKKGMKEKREDDQEKKEGKEDEAEEDDKEEENPRNKAFNAYNMNLKKIKSLNIKYFFSMTIITITKLYWLIIFLVTGIMYTSQDLSAGIIVYIFIFGITFIRMFLPVILKLSNFMKKDTYFISKVIRHHLLEKGDHFQNLKSHRDFSFRFLLGFSLLLIFLFYFYGVFDLFQNGCNVDLWKTCEKDRFSPIFGKGSSPENYVVSISYLLGFYVNMQEMGVLKASWKHLFFAILIAFDVYMQKLQYHFYSKNFQNRRDYRTLINKNIRLQAIIVMDREKLKKDKSIKKQLEDLCNDKPRDPFSLSNYKKRMDEIYGKLLGEIASKYNNINEDERTKGEIQIKRFLEAFRKASYSKVLLSESQNKYKFIKGLKKIFEEVIIFLLICTSIAKLDVWSFVYIIISIYLITSTKTMRKYYYIFCSIIVAVFAQLLIFISNINQSTDPTPNLEVLTILKDTLNIPWYTGDLKYGFFYGFGTSKSQINLIWMDFIDIIILYIYIDYFSYCIYQDSESIGQSQDIKNKINYFKLRSNKNFLNCVKNESPEKIKEYKECMLYNLDINVDDLEIKLHLKPQTIPENESKKELETVKNGKEVNDVVIKVEDTIKTKSDNIDNQKDIKKEDKKEEKKDEKKEEEEDDDDKEDEENKENKRKRQKMELSWFFVFGNLVEVIYLSSHNIILIIIIIISMMVSGLLSLFYIIISLFFLITSYKFYLGQKYYYPKAIKKLLRIAIIIDIGIQILYQMPVFYRDSSEKTTLDKILDIIGFNRIIDYGKGNNASYEDKDDIKIYPEQMILVFSKALTYFFMGIQILVYSSQNFQEHYLIYLFTRKNELKRKSLMNAFRFNNKRIITMNNSLQARQEMPLKMTKLQEDLTKWGEKLSNIDTTSAQTNTVSKSFHRKESAFLRGKKKEQKIYKEKQVKEYIKKKILDKTLIQLEIWLYQFSVDYSKINPVDKDLFEKDVIQGHTTTKTFIEKMVDLNVDHLTLDDFTEPEMVQLKKFLVDTENQMKKMEEQKIKKRNEREKEFVKRIIPIGGLIQDNRSLVDIIKSEEEKIKVVDLTQPKFREVVDLLKSDLFQKYLKTSFLLKSLMIDLVTYCAKKFQFICYFIMILNHIQNASLISMVFPISIFCFAIFEYPRPRKSYWNFCIIYSIIILAIKNILQLQLFVEICGYKEGAENEEKISVYVDALKNLQNYKIGFKYMESTYDYAFFNYIVFDALIIIFLLINNLILIINGLWEKREQEIENIYYAMDRVIKTRDLLPEDIDDLKQFNDHFLEHDRKEGTLKIKKYEQKKFSFLKKFKKIKKEKKPDEEEKNPYTTIDTYSEKDKKYFESLFPYIRNEKPGNDFYAQYTIGMVLVIIFIIIFYTSMIKDITYDALNQETNQFSGSMVLYLVLHIFYLCYDRVLYINQNRNRLKYQYILYNKKNMKQISQIQYELIQNKIYDLYDEVKTDNFIIPPDYIKTIKKDHEIAYIQIEYFNKILLQKYILHLFIVLAGHAFIFFYAPMYGNYNLNHNVFCSKDDVSFDECNDFNDNPALICFYLLYLIYFIFSGMQIKFGFYDLKKKSLLKAGYSTVNKTINTTFKSIPFIYEIKLAIDWAFTPTSLDIFQWAKYENVYDTVYTTYCTMKAKNVSKIGQLVGKVMKAGMGGVLSFVLIILLVFPILLFSSLNPTNKENKLNGAKMKIDLSFKDSFGLIKNYTLYESTKVETILDYTENEEEFENEWNLYSYSDSVEVKNFPKDQIQRLNFSNTSERHWGMTKPHIDNLINLLKFNESGDYDNTNNIVEIQLIIDYQFERYLPVEARTPGERHGIVIYDKTNRTRESTLQISKIREGISNCTTTEATFKNLYSAPLRLTANINSREITDEDTFSKLDIYLGFTGCRKIKKEEYSYSNIDNYYNNYNDNYIEDGEEETKSYLEAYFTFGILGKRGKEGLFFYILSDKVSSFTSGYSVIGFYLTFILLVGNYVRNFFAGEPSKITLTEMPECYKIIELCEGIKIARYSFKFEQEENFYYILMELMRSPNYLKLLTESSVEQFNKRKKITEKSNDPNGFSDDDEIVK